MKNTLLIFICLLFSFCNAHKYIVYDGIGDLDNVKISEAPGPGYTYIEISRYRNDTTVYTLYHPCKSHIQKAIKSVRQNGVYVDWYGVTDSIGGYHAYELTLANDITAGGYTFIPLNEEEHRIFKIAMDSISSDSCINYDLTKLIGFIRK